MRTLRLLLLCALLVSINVGCTGIGYVADRGRDLGDVFTMTLGYGAGAKARLGGVQVGVLGMNTLVGVQGGDGITADRAWHGVLYEPANMEYNWGVFGFEGFSGQEYAFQRGKAYAAPAIAIFSWPENWREYIARHGDPDMAERVPDYPFNGAPYFAQIEVVAAAGPAIRLGVNVAEAIDFVLGWTTLDIFADDLAP